MTHAALRFALLVMYAGALAACGSGAATDERPSEPSPIQIGAESVATAKKAEIRTGPIVSGQLSAEREATVRAEVGGSVVSTAFEVGQSVSKGDVLARIEARDLADNVASANVAIKAAEQALAVARTEEQRTETLVRGGALAERDLEAARNAVAAAQSQLAAARAKAASAQAQLGNTVVRSPLTGVVSTKSVNTGDVVTAGTALYTIIDPTSMRLEASVPSEQIGGLEPGVPVVFTVRGYDGQTFTGHIERISPAADPATRQVPIYVSIPNAGGRLISGLFAEGRVESEVKTAVVIPGNAVDTTTGSPVVTRVSNGRAEHVQVTLGVRDAETERVEVTSGLSEGDVVLTGAARGVTPGTPVTIGQ